MCYGGGKEWRTRKPGNRLSAHTPPFVSCALLDRHGPSSVGVQELPSGELVNLTLVNKRLNPSLSNADWHTKARALVQHSVLHLNKQLLSSFTESDFSEAQIRERGQTLAGQATTIWPGPKEI